MSKDPMTNCKKDHAYFGQKRRPCSGIFYLDIYIYSYIYIYMKQISCIRVYVQETQRQQGNASWLGGRLVPVL